MKRILVASLALLLASPLGCGPDDSDRAETEMNAGNESSRNDDAGAGASVSENGKHAGQDASEVSKNSSVTSKSSKDQTVSLNRTGIAEFSDRDGAPAGHVDWNVEAGDTPIVVSSIAPLKMPSKHFEEVLTVYLEEAEMAQSVNVNFLMPDESLAADYIFLIETDFVRSARYVSRSTLTGPAYFHTYASPGTAVSLVRLNPAKGCTEYSDVAEFTSDAELEALATTYRIKGSLVIIGPDVTSLESLNCLLVVDGWLQVSLTNISSAKGLDNLATAASLSFKGNSALTTVQLPSAWATSLSFLHNPKLENVQANLLSGTDLLFTTNGEETSELELEFDSLAGAQAIHLISNPKLKTLDGLGTIERATEIVIEKNESLENIDNLEKLNSVVGSIRIVRNNQLTNTSGLAALRSIGASPVGDVSVEGLSISGNPKLESIELPRLQHVAAESMVMIRDNPVLSKVAVPKLERIRSLRILDCGQDAANLSLSFETLEACTESFELWSNETLTSVDGFPSLNSVNSLRISGNATLPTCDALALSSQIEELDDTAPPTIEANLVDDCVP